MRLAMIVHVYSVNTSNVPKIGLLKLVYPHISLEIVANAKIHLGKFFRCFLH